MSLTTNGVSVLEQVEAVIGSSREAVLDGRSFGFWIDEANMILDSSIFQKGREFCEEEQFVVFSVVFDPKPPVVHQWYTSGTQNTRLHVQ